MATTKTYTLQDIKNLIHWVEYKDLSTFLADNGITPATVINTSKRTWRAYDQDAYDKASALREERRLRREIERSQQRAAKQQSSSAVTTKTMRRAPNKELLGHILALSEKVDLLQAVVNELRIQLTYRRAA